jgi:tetratricopeptide (TPR) repeat protein
LVAAGDVTRAREMHELASKAGWRTSSIVLRRWYLEGFGGMVKDPGRAMELETLAASQVDVPRHEILVRYLSGGSNGRETLYFKEPVGDADPMADEVYRLARFSNAEITPEGRDWIARVYEYAKTNKMTVADLLERRRKSAERDVALPGSVVAADVNAAREALKAKNVEKTFELAAAIKEKLETQTPLLDPLNLIAWGTIADLAGEIANNAQSLNDASLVERVAKFRDRLIAAILAVDVEGSSPRMSLAGDFEDLARRAKSVKDLDYSVKLYDRAIELRNYVRARDPSNAKCQCRIAMDYRAVGEIEVERKDIDAAMLAYQRAIVIYEDLGRQEPNNKGWDGLIAETAHELAEVMGRRREEQTALLYAQTEARIRKEYAAQHSAASNSRIDYAKSLELVAKFARQVARLRRGGDNRVSDQYFELAVNSLFEANAIRESVLMVDPKNGECRCDVGTNYTEISEVYNDWGRKDGWVKSLDLEVQVNREVLQKQPDSAQKQYNLAASLERRAKATERTNETKYELAVADLIETATLLRPLKDSKDFPDAKDRLIFNLGILSNDALFVKKDEVALAAAEEALALDPSQLWIATNKAHGLMFLGRIEEARRLYLANKEWEREIAKDFVELREFGRSDPLMDQILAELGVTTETRRNP